MREFWAQTAAFALAVLVHILMAAIVVFGTMDWRPFRPPPALTGMTIEAVIVDTSQIKAAREQARREAEEAARQKTARERRERELEEQRLRRERERAAEAEAERRRQQELAAKKREEDLRLQKLRQQQELDRQERLRKQQAELEEIRRKREEATRQRKLEEERLKQLDARKRAEAEKQRQALAEAELQRQLANEQAAFRAGEIATKQEEYYSAIQSQVTNNWYRPPTARSGLRCRLKIVQIPGGEVISAVIAGTCIADEATRRSIVAAVERAGTLPYRGFEEVFEREIDFIFTYDDD